MPFKRHALHMKNEDGSGLVLSLMTLLVLSVLGASLGAVTIGSFKIGDVNRDDTSAYYIAEAGANMAYEEMKAGVMEAYTKYPNSEGLFYDEIEDDHKGLLKSIEENTYEFEDQFGDKPTVSIRFSEPVGSNPKSYTIVSTGEVAGKTRTVEKPIRVTWAGKPPTKAPVIPNYLGLIANNSIHIKGNLVTGGIYVNSLEENAIELSYTNVNNAVFYHKPQVEPDKIIKYENWNVPKTEEINDEVNWNNFNGIFETFPEYPSFNYIEDKKSISVKNGEGPLELEIEEDITFDEIYLDNNTHLYINTGNKDLSIATKHLNLSNGHIHLIGDGNVTFHVRDKITLSSSSTINKEGDSSKLIIYYSGDNNISTTGAELIKGLLFSKSENAMLDFGGSLKITGGIVSGSKNIKLHGGMSGSPFIFAPNASTELSGGGTYEGIIVSDSIFMTGGSEFKFKYFDMGNFLLGSSSTSPEASPEILINSDPALEAN